MKGIVILKKYVKYIVILFLISVLIGFLFSRIRTNDDLVAQNISGNTSEVGSSDETVVQTNIDEVKITPNTNIVFETKYQDCKHIEITEKNDVADFVNMTEDELKENYPDWIVQSFSIDEVQIYRLEDGLCSNHFKIALNENNMVCAYSLTQDYDIELYKETEISAEYLTDEDLENLEEGIYIYGESELNSTLESFE